MGQEKNSSVLIIYTGGTIGMMEDPVLGTLVPFDFGHLPDYVPELKRFNYHIEVLAFEHPIDSSDVTTDTWERIAKMVEVNYNQFDGFVILHGTDTMAYSASALSFMLENLAKPVIFTGSQLPIGKLRTDGKENLITAVEIAAAQKDGSPIVQEVAVYFESKLFRGNRTHKYNTEDFDAFQSSNFPSLAEAGVHIVFNFPSLFIPLRGTFSAHVLLNDNVTILKLFPGINERTVRAVLETKGLRGVIVETFGSGNAPRQQWLFSLLSEAVSRGIAVVNITQCNQGFVEQGRYETSSSLQKMGVISGSDMTTEAAVTKLMYLIGKGFSNTEISQLMATSIRGELTHYSRAI